MGVLCLDAPWKKLIWATKLILHRMKTDQSVRSLSHPSEPTYFRLDFPRKRICTCVTEDLFRLVLIGPLAPEILWKTSSVFNLRQKSQPVPFMRQKFSACSVTQKLKNCSDFYDPRFESDPAVGYTLIKMHLVLTLSTFDYYNQSQRQNLLKGNNQSWTLDVE